MKKIFTLLTISSFVILVGCSSGNNDSTSSNETNTDNSNNLVVEGVDIEDLGTISDSSENKVIVETNENSNNGVGGENDDSIEMIENEKFDENTLYYVVGETPMLLFNNKLYADTEGAVASQDNTIDDLSLLTENKIIPILKLPERSTVFDVLDGKDIRDTLFFSIESENYTEYLVDSGGAVGHGNRSIDVYSYSISENKIKSLFSSRDADIEGKYILFLDSFADHLLAVNLYSCWNCEAPYPETYLWNASSKKGENIGKVLDFQWKNSLGLYHYKEYVTEECENVFTGGNCPVDADTIKWQKAEFNSLI